MRIKILLTILLLSLAIGGGAAYARSQEAPQDLLPLTDLPPYILLVGQSALPDVEFQGFTWGLTDNLKPAYELTGVAGEQTVNIHIFLDGTIEEVKRELTLSDVPTAVIGLLDKYVPNLEVTHVNEATLANRVHRYEFQGNAGNIDLDIQILDTANSIRIVELGKR